LYHIIVHKAWHGRSPFVSEELIVTLDQSRLKD
jgi:hypothetical protein